MKYRSEIDGLRAVAVLPVILFHAGFEIFSGGFVGVDVFFVISGYLITTILINDIERDDFSIIKFYERRARRILPALFFVILCCIPFAWAWMLPSQMKDFSQSLVAVTFFASNILFWRESGYFEASSEENPLLHTWSLAVEEQYYLLFPIFLFFVWRFGKNRVFWTIVVFAAVSLALSEWGWRNKPTANFYLAPTRAWELFAGSIAAFIVHKHGVRKNETLSLLGLGAIVFSIFAYDKSTPFPSVYALVPVLGVILLILFAERTTWAARLLSIKLIVGIGLISYSAYLWHQPLFAFARLRNITEPSDMLMGGLATLALLLAWVTWRFVEQPFRAGKSTLFTKQKTIFAASAVFGLVISGIGLFGHISDGAVVRSSILPAWILDAGQDKNDYAVCLRGYEKFDAELAVAECSAGSENDPLVVLVGDSHADHYAFALREGAARSGFKFIQLTVNSCLPFPGLLSVKRDCTNYAEQTDAVLDALEPDLVVVAARWTVYLTNSRFDNGEGGVEHGPVDPFILGDLETGTNEYKDALFNVFESGVKNLLERGFKVLLVQPSPEAGWNVPNTFSKMAMFESNTFEGITISTDWNNYLERNGDVIRLLDRLNAKNLSTYKSSDVLCNTFLPRRCINAIDQNILYYDDDHFSNTGALFLQESIIESVTSALVR